MTLSPRDTSQALLYAARQAQHPSRSWAGMCQMFVRSSYGIPSLFASAWAQWLGADPEDRHRGGHPSEAPVGAALCFKVSGRYGHIMLAANNFGNGTRAAWSNDLVAKGRIDKVARTSPTVHWGQGYLGYLTAVNDWDLRLNQPVANRTPPKPKQDRRYQGIRTAITNLEAALETAQRQHDARDVTSLKQEIARLKDMYSKMRRV
jgi:hypothetical protein